MHGPRLHPGHVALQQLDVDKARLNRAHLNVPHLQQPERAPLNVPHLQRLEMDKARLNMVSADAFPDQPLLSDRFRRMSEVVTETFKDATSRVNRFFANANIQKDPAVSFFGAEEDGEAGPGSPHKWWGQGQVCVRVWVHALVQMC